MLAAPTSCLHRASPCIGPLQSDAVKWLKSRVVLQGWVARRLVRRQLAAWLAPLIGCAPGERPREAAALSVQLLNAGAQGGYARDVAAQVSNKERQTCSSSQPPAALLCHQQPCAAVVGGCTLTVADLAHGITGALGMCRSWMRVG